MRKLISGAGTVVAAPLACSASPTASAAAVGSATAAPAGGKVKPHEDLQGVDVSLTGALDPSIGGMVAHQTCAW